MSGGGEISTGADTAMTTESRDEPEEARFISTAKAIITTHTHETRAVGHTDCDACLDADANAVASIVSAQNRAATRMREACLGIVRELRTDWKKDLQHEEDFDWRVDTATKIITALESLTLDQVEKETMNEKDKLTAEGIGYAFQDLLGFAARVDLENRIVGALTTVRREAREAAFTQMGLELRRFGPNIRRVDLLARFQEMYREALAAASSPLPAEPPPGNVLCECGHRRSAHQMFSDHDECVECEAREAAVNDGLCCEFRPAKPRQEGETPVVARTIARDVVNEILNVPRFVRNPESTIIEIENKVAAIITRYLVGTPLPETPDPCAAAGRHVCGPMDRQIDKGEK